MERIIRCRGCGWLDTMKEGQLPPGGCPTCGGTRWKAGSDPIKEYPLTAADRKFLRALRISAE
jgi:hypothetical protein